MFLRLLLPFWKQNMDQNKFIWKPIINIDFWDHRTHFPQFHDKSLFLAQITYFENFLH